MHGNQAGIGCVPPQTLHLDSPTSIWLTYWGSHHTKSKFDDLVLMQTPYFTAGNGLAEDHSWAVAQQRWHRGLALPCPWRPPPAPPPPTPSQLRPCAPNRNNLRI